MTIDAIAALAPQKTFLIQASEASFDTFLASAIVHNPLTNGLSVPRFTIDHARSLVEFINEGTGSERLYIVFFSVFSPDAAQVMLKSLEEPDPDTTIVLLTPYPYLVPTTIRSRVMLLQGASGAGQSFEGNDFARDAMLSYIKEAFASDAEEDAATRRAKAVALLDAFEAHVRVMPGQHDFVAQAQKAEIIYKAKDMLFAGNLPTKYVLEYAASMVL